MCRHGGSMRSQESQRGALAPGGQRRHGDTAPPPASSQASLPPHCSLPMLLPSILTSPAWLPGICFVHFAALGRVEQEQRRGGQDQAPPGRAVGGAADLQSCWLCTASHLSALFQVMLVVCHPPVEAAVPRLPLPAQGRPQVMASSAVLWSRSFPSPLPFTCSTHMPHTMAEPRRASVSHHASTLHHASASHIHSMKSTGSMAEGSAFLPCVLA